MDEGEVSVTDGEGGLAIGSEGGGKRALERLNVRTLKQGQKTQGTRQKAQGRKQQKGSGRERALER